MVAICANDNRLQIYEGCNSPSFASWRLAHVLEEHDLIISGISWSPVTNKIVTCSHDRNAFVWSYDAAQVREGNEGGAPGLSLWTGVCVCVVVVVVVVVYRRHRPV